MNRVAVAARAEGGGTRGWVQQSEARSQKSERRRLAKRWEDCRARQAEGDRVAGQTRKRWHPYSEFWLLNSVSLLGPPRSAPAATGPGSWPRGVTSCLSPTRSVTLNPHHDTPS